MPLTKRLKLMNSRGSAREGFTLLEVLVAMAIFSVAILGLAIGATSILRANQTSYFNTVAANLAQDKLEELKARTVANIISCSSNCDSPALTYKNVTFTRTWIVTANSPTNGVNRLDVSVQWKDYTNHTLTASSAIRQ